MKLLLMRHGETDWNTCGRLQGQTDIPLNDAGRKMAVSCAEGMKDVPYDICISSPLLRARETAELVTKGRSVPLLFDDRLKEASFGVWEGLICKAEGYSVPLSDFGLYWRDPENPEMDPSVEKLTHVAQRVEEFLTDLVNDPRYQDKTILLVVHGCVLRSFQYIASGRETFCGGVSYNCQVHEARPYMENGRVELEMGDSHIYYDKAMVHNYYASMKQG